MTVLARAFVVLCALAALRVPALGQRPERKKYQPNVLVIVLDDVGTDKLRMYGESDSLVHSGPPYCGTPVDPFDYPPTPNLDQLVAGAFPGMLGGGIRFDRAYGAPLCSMARACIQTGRYGFRTGLGVVDDGGPLRKRLSNQEVLLPELLRHGIPAPTSPSSLRRYKSGAFGKWHLSALPVCDPVVASDFSHPVVNGFNVFQGTMTNVGTTLSNPGDHYNWTKVTATPGHESLTRYQVGPVLKVEPFVFSPACSTTGVLLQTTTYSEETFTASITRQDAVEWINAQKQPFFAYVAFNAPHFPYQMPPLSLLSTQTRNALNDPANCRGPYCPGQVAGETSGCGTTTCGDDSACETMQRRLFFHAMVEAVDTEIGNLLSQMDPEKRANTLVVVLADNGTPETVVENTLHDPTHGKGQMYELSVRVPMIVAGRPVPEGGHTSSALVHAVDLWRTLAELCRAQESLAAPLQPLDSISFADVVRDPSLPGQRTEVFTQGFGLPGAYQPTEWGPYVPGCPDPTVPGVWFCMPLDVGQHGRTFSDGHYKLIVALSTPGANVLPEGTADVAPTYTEMLFDLLSDPEETNDLMPQVPFDSGLAAIRDDLRARMNLLSGL